MFRRVSRRFGPREPLANPGDILVNQGPEDADKEVARIEDSFHRLMGKVGTLVARSVSLVSRLSTKIDAALQKSFLNDTDALTEETTSDPYNPSHDSGFLQGVGLEEVLDSFFDFGKSVLDEFGAVVTQVFDDISESAQEEKMKGNAASNRVIPVNSSKKTPADALFLFGVAKGSFPRFLQNRKLCRDLRKQTSECWQLQNQCEACQGALLTGEAPPPAHLVFTSPSHL